MFAFAHKLSSFCFYFISFLYPFFLVENAYQTISANEIKYMLEYEPAPTEISPIQLLYKYFNPALCQFPFSAFNGISFFHESLPAFLGPICACFDCLLCLYLKPIKSKHFMHLFHFQIPHFFCQKKRHFWGIPATKLGCISDS